MRYLSALIVALALASPAKAAPIVVDLVLAVENGTVVGEGSFSVEGAEFTGRGEEKFYPANSGLLDLTAPKTLLSIDITIEASPAPSPRLAATTMPSASPSRARCCCSAPGCSPSAPRSVATAHDRPEPTSRLRRPHGLC